MVYRHCTVKDQYRHMDLLIRHCYNSVMERWSENKIVFKFYFELNKSGHLHAHGIITCTEHQKDYIQDWFYDECGRAGRSSMLQKACVNVQLLANNNLYRYNNGLPTWEHYIIKDQTVNWRSKYAEIILQKNL